MNEQHRTTAPDASSIEKIATEFSKIEGPISTLASAVKAFDWMICVLMDEDTDKLGRRFIADGQAEALYRLSSEALKLSKDCDERANTIGTAFDNMSTGTPVPAAAGEHLSEGFFAEHQVSLHSRDDEADSLVAITDAAHSARGLISALKCIDWDKADARVLQGLYTGLQLAEGAIANVGDRLERQLAARRTAA